MKKRKSNIGINTIKNEGGCCTPSTAVTEEVVSNEPCCEPPANGSSCCDKNESKEVNIQNTGCC